jgi:hypothetical protein
MASLVAAKPADLTIPKLTNDNYKPWRELVVAALEGRGVWEYAEGTQALPEDLNNKRIWRQNNAIAVGIIKGTLSDVQLGHVMGMTDAKEVWDTLKKIHQFSDRPRLKGLLAEFIRFRFDGMMSIDEGASKLNQLQTELGP